MAGSAYETGVAQRKQRYAHAEDWLKQEIARAQWSNTSLSAVNTALRERSTILHRQAAMAKREGRSAIQSEITRVLSDAVSRTRQHAQASKDQAYILADHAAQRASNFAAYQREIARFSGARSEHATLVRDLEQLKRSLVR